MLHKLKLKPAQPLVVDIGCGRSSINKLAKPDFKKQDTEEHIQINHKTPQPTLENEIDPFNVRN